MIMKKIKFKLDIQSNNYVDVVAKLEILIFSSKQKQTQSQEVFIT